MSHVTSNLPTWDLSDLYSHIDDPKINQDLELSESSIKFFTTQYEGKLQTLTGDQLFTAIQTFENLQESLGKLSTFAYLIYAENRLNEKGLVFFQKMRESVSQQTSHLVFFTLELNSFSKELLNKKMDDSEKLRHYKPWLKNIQHFKNHELSKDLERLLHDKTLTASANWVRLYDETLAQIKTTIDGVPCDTSDMINRMTDPSEATRKKAAKAFGACLQEKSSTLTFIYNTLIQDKSIDDAWRQYDQPISSRNAENFVEDPVVDALLTTTRSFFPQLSHRYYTLKAKWLGVNKLSYWDRNAPLPETKQKPIPWGQAKEIVLHAYARFSPTMANIGKDFFDHKWIDARLQPGKDTGAFSHPCVPSVHPYILQNYHGKIWDVMTLAHELGHGIHQVLSAQQGYLMSDTPLTLAETASIFGEMLTFQSLMDDASPLEKKILLAGKVNDMLSSIVRQVSFCLFEQRVHAQRKKGELTADEIGKIWLEAQKESLGPIFSFDQEYSYYWSYISHFFHVPFYVYAYAFGNCLVNALYATYQRGLPHFEPTYLKLLQSGGTLRHTDLAKLFGLNTADPNFWAEGLGLVSSWIDELEELES